MTYQSYTWALDQDVPGDAWRVLLALANRAEHRTGKIYYDAEEVAYEAKVAVTSLSKYLGALRRNGYLVEVKKGKEKHYWLQLDRPSTKEFSWDAAESDAEGDEAPAPRLASPAAPARFDKALQAKESKEIAAPPAGQPAGLHPIIEGSPFDDEWTRHCRAKGIRKPFVRSIILKGGEVRRGYYMPSALPPKEETQEQIAV